MSFWLVRHDLNAQQEGLEASALPIELLTNIIMADLPRFERGQNGPKPFVLPLHYRSIKMGAGAGFEHRVLLVMSQRS